jgi:hypothetical protein
MDEGKTETKDANHLMIKTSENEKEQVLGDGYLKKVR